MNSIVRILLVGLSVLSVNAPTLNPVDNREEADRLLSRAVKQLAPLVRSVESGDTADLLLKKAATIQASNRGVDDANQTLSLMLDPVSIVGALCDIAAAALAKGDKVTSTGAIERAKALAAKEKNDHFKQMVLEQVACAQGKSGDAIGAIETLRAIKDGFSRDDSAQQVVRVVADTGDLESARKIGVTITNSLFADNATTWIKSGEARGLLKSGNASGAYQAAAKIAEPDMRARLLTEISCALWNTTERASAERALKRALELAQSLGQNLVQGDVLIQIARVSYLMGRKSEASAMLQLAFKYARKEDLGPFVDGTIARIAMAQADCGDSAAALNTAASIKTPALGASALIGIARAKARDIDRASVTAWADSLSDPVKHAAALIGIAETLSEALK